MIINVQNIGYIICLASSLLLSIIIVYRSKSGVGQLFALFLFCIFIWVLCSMLADNIKNYNQALFWTKMCMVGPIVATPLFWVFAQNFPDRCPLLNKKKLVLSLLTTLPFLALVPTRWNIVSIDILAYGVDFAPGPLYLFFLLYLLSAIVAGIILLYRKTRMVSATEKRSLCILYTGAITLGLTSATMSLILPLLRIPAWNFLSPLSTLVIVSLTYYALTRHHLFGIKLVIGSAVYLALFAAVAYLLFYAYYSIQEKFLDETYQNVALIVGFVLFVAFTFILFTINKRLKRTVNYYIVNRKYDPEEVSEQLTSQLSQTLTYKGAIDRILETVKKTVQPKSANIYLATNRKTKPNTLFDKIAIALKEKNYSDAILEEEIGDYSTPALQTIKKALGSSSIQAVFPITLNNNLLGVLLLGEQKDSSMYTLEEIQFIKSICVISAVALDRISLLQKAKQVAVLKAEKEKEQEIIDIMGHELRTPATTAKLAVEHLIAENKKKSLSRKTLNENLEYALSGINQQYSLAQRYLTASRLSKGAFKVNLVPTDVTSIAQKVLQRFNIAAAEKGLIMKVSSRKSLPQVLADPEALYQILSNLIENAVKYTEKGTILVKITSGSAQVRVEVIDSGIGILEDEISKLGQQFYRTKYARKKNIPGTGLGLYVAASLIKAHGGRMLIERKKKGSIFSFNLKPIIS